MGVDHRHVIAPWTAKHQHVDTFVVDEGSRVPSKSRICAINPCVGAVIEANHCGTGLYHLSLQRWSCHRKLWPPCETTSRAVACYITVHILWEVWNSHLQFVLASWYLPLSSITNASLLAPLDFIRDRFMECVSWKWSMQCTLRQGSIWRPRHSQVTPRQ